MQCCEGSLKLNAFIVFTKCFLTGASYRVNYCSNSIYCGKHRYALHCTI